MRPRSRRSSASRFRICACTETSSAEVGSSHTTMRGRSTSARAIATRWRWPPDSSAGRRSPIAVARPTRVQHLLDPARRISAARQSAMRHQRQATMSRTRGARIERGEGILEHRLDQPRARLAVERRPAAGRRSAMSPEVGGSRPRIRRARVDLPQPDSPTMPSTSPSRHARQTPSTAHRRRRDMPAVERKCWRTSRDLDRRGHAAGSDAAMQRQSWPSRRLRRGIARAQVSSAKSQRSRKRAAVEAGADARHGAGDGAERLRRAGSCPAPARSAAGPRV